MAEKTNKYIKSAPFCYRWNCREDSIKAIIRLQATEGNCALLWRQQGWLNKGKKRNCQDAGSGSRSYLACAASIFWPVCDYLLFSDVLLRLDPYTSSVCCHWLHLSHSEHVSWSTIFKQNSFILPLPLCVFITAIMHSLLPWIHCVWHWLDWLYPLDSELGLADYLLLIVIINFFN